MHYLEPTIQVHFPLSEIHLKTKIRGYCLHFPDHVVANAVQGHISEIWGVCVSSDCTKYRMSNLRWVLFKKKQSTSGSLTPNKNLLPLGIFWAHFLCMNWANNITAKAIIPSQGNFCLKRREGKWIDLMTRIPPDPEAVIRLIKCNWLKLKTLILKGGETMTLNRLFVVHLLME